MLATNEKGDEKRTIKWMEAVWGDCKGDDLWTLWDIFGVLGGLWKQSMLDSKPLRDRIHAQFDQSTLKRPLIVSAVDLETGKHIVFDENSMETGLDISESLISSSALPLAFQPNNVNGFVLGDGGVYANLQLSEGVLKCKEMGHEMENIIVDVIMCPANTMDIKEWTLKDSRYQNAWQVFQRKE
mmetsp:Transcript_3036/g.5121  ORF Transcript_3036/g.5121 Transcript_3036/m.5121 type:complete len:184 (+) Transcript_3036:307-858(+)